jgi:hypothetical protein
MNTALISFPTPPGLPAPIRRDIKRLATALDKLGEHYDRMSEACDALTDDYGRPQPQALDNARFWLNNYLSSDSRKCLLAGWFKTTHDQLMRQLAPEWWEGDAWDSPVRPSATMQSVAALIGFYNQAIKDDFVANLIEYVASVRPHPYDIAEAWEDIKLEKAHPPAIAEVRKFYQAASSRWSNRWDAEDGIERIASDLEREITLIEEKERQRIAHEEQQRLEREARRLEIEARIQQQREKEAREQLEIRTYLDSVDDSGKDEFDLETHYDYCWDRIIALHRHVTRQLNYGEYHLGCQHHEGCSIREIDECDCEPSLWAVNDQAAYFVDTRKRVNLCLTLADAKWRATPMRPCEEEEEERP